MSEPTQPNPVAIPWTPDNRDQNPTGSMTAAPPVLSAATSNAPVQAHGQHGYAQPYQAGGHQAQPHAAHQTAPQTSMPYGQAPMAQPQQQPYPSAGIQNPPAHTKYSQNPATQQSHMQPQQAYQQSDRAYMPPYQGQAGMMPPPLAPHMQHSTPPVEETAAKSKSLLGRLLKRSPRPTSNDAALNDGQLASQTQGRFQNRLSPQGQSQIPSQFQDPLQPQYSAPQMGAIAHSPLQAQGLPKITGSSGSLFNKNFALGAVTGIIVGAFVLPILINLVAGDTSPQTQAQFQTAPSGDINASDAAFNTEETFLDAAIAADES